MSELTLAAEFEQTTRDQWLALVNKALKGGDFEKKLVGRTYDGIRLEPLYSRGEAGSALGTTRSSGRSAIGFQPWSIAQLYAGSDPKAVNAAIREDLHGGVSEIVVQFAAPGQFGLPPTAEAVGAALDGVRPDWVGITSSAGERFAEAARALLETLPRLHTDWAKGQIDLGADPLGSLARSGGLDRDRTGSAHALAALIKSASAHPNVRVIAVDARPYHEAGASEAQELAAMAATLVAYLRWLDEAGIAPADVLARTTVALAADASIFLTIAKLRAARGLVARIAEACGAAQAAGTVRFTVTTSGRMMARRDAYTNLLRTTVACAASAMAGADAITVLPFSWALGQPDAFARRMARNTQIVLMEESNLGRVVDPAGGAYYVETLTKEMATAAWSLFQAIEQRTSGNERGMLAALQDGHVQALIAKTATERRKNIATGRDELIGVATFPNLSETQFDVVPHPVAEDGADTAISCEPLVAARLAEPFEALRDAADAHADRTHARPRIFLANLGTIPEFNARATFAQNFFAAGGIEALGNDGFTASGEVGRAFSKSGAKAACICSSDANYALLAEAAAQALKSAGATHVWLAGRPGDKLEAYRAAGIDAFIYTGCDAVATLRAAHGALGVGNG